MSILFDVLSAFVESRKLFQDIEDGVCHDVDHGVDVCDKPLGGSDLRYWQHIC